MRIVKLWLDGYGRFVGRQLHLGDGLQIIAGPNEQGKSTVLAFIGDMLYGQKRSASQRLYEESNEMRRPWADPGNYAGRMAYVLDNGHEIEIRRIFERQHESVQVYDRTIARDVTDQFPKLRNRESTFAEHHLGLTKAVFLNTATITYMTLENLGDSEALGQIRERILSLADSAEESSTSEAALAVLESRITLIGRPTARTRALPAARARLEELDREHATCTAVRQEIAELEDRREAVTASIKALEQRRSACQVELAALEWADRAGRLATADRYQQEIDDITQVCFSLSGVREFPADQEPEMQRLINVLNTAKTQVRRTEEEYADIQRKHHEELDRLGVLASQHIEDVPPDTEQRLEELETSVARLTERLEQADGERDAAQSRLDRAQRDLGGLPDFSRVAADPVNWFTQLAATFRLLREKRDDERAALERIRDQLTRAQEQLATPRRIFQPFVDNFPAAAADYKVALRLQDERGDELLSRIEQIRSSIHEHDAEGPRFRIWTLACVAAMTALALTAYYVHNWSVFIPAAFFAALMGYFVFKTLNALSCAKRLRHELEEAEKASLELAEEVTAKRKPIEDALSEAGYETVRELDALYERFLQDKDRLASLGDSLRAQEERLAEHEERAREFFGKMQSTLAEVGVDLQAEEDVLTAAHSAMARYQEYRDAKRRVDENRDQPARYAAEAERIRAELESEQERERDLALVVRRFMRDNEFPDESRFTSALKAVRAYRARCSQVREKRARFEMATEQMAEMKRRLSLERADLQKQQDAVERFLRNAGAESVENWRELAAKAREYRTAWERRAILQDKLDVVLQSESLEVLRMALAGEPPEAVLSGTKPEALKEEVVQLTQTIDDQRKEHTSIEIRIGQHGAGVRSLNEIEEERATLARRVEDLSLEFEATVHAATLIEEVAIDKHARIAPRLASGASRYLAEVTNGAYKELRISRDLGITVRIPQTEALRERPERRLSRGTVDQIYLALRLALVEGLSRNGERIPMLLDDPLANYDDDRLMRAMEVLKQVGQKHQILFFTCHENVVEAAESLKVDVLHL